MKDAFIILSKFEDVYAASVTISSGFLMAVQTMTKDKGIMFSWNTVFSIFNLFPWILATYTSPDQMPFTLLLILVTDTIMKALRMYIHLLQYL